MIVFGKVVGDICVRNLVLQHHAVIHGNIDCKSMIIYGDGQVTICGKVNISPYKPNHNTMLLKVPSIDTLSGMKTKQINNNNEPDINSSADVDEPDPYYEPIRIEIDESMKFLTGTGNVLMNNTADWNINHIRRSADINADINANANVNNQLALEQI